VAEAAVVGTKDATTGQAIGAFVILRAGNDPSDALVAELRDHVGHTIGPIAKPKTVALHRIPPEDRSGKIMRRLLRDVAEDQALGDTTTLADPSVVKASRRGTWPRRAATTSDVLRPGRATSPITGPGTRARSTPGAAVVVDIDGVLSDAASRQHYLEGAPAQLERVSSRPAATTRSSKR